MMKKRYVLFDLDGTLIDSRGDISGTLEYVALEQGLPSIPVPNELLGAPLRNIISSLYPSIGMEKQNSMLDRFRSVYDSKEYSKSFVYPGIHDVIASFSRFGVAMFVATMKPILPAKRILEQKRLLNKFADVKSPDSWTGERLVKAEIIRRIMNEFGIKPDDAVYVGDQPTDVLSARDAEIECIAVRYGYGDRDDLHNVKPMAEINTPLELFELLFSS